MPTPWNGLQDLTGNGNNLTLKASAVYVTGASGVAVSGNAATMGADAVANAKLQVTGDLSMFWHGVIAGDTSGNGSLFIGVLATVDDSFPYISYGIERNATISQADVSFLYSQGSAWSRDRFTSTANASYGSMANYCLSAVAGGTVSLYKNGVDQGAGVLGGSGSAAYVGPPLYTTPIVCISNYTSEPTLWSGGNTSLGLIYSRALSVQDATWLSMEPYAMLRPAMIRAGGSFDILLGQGWM